MNDKSNSGTGWVKLHRSILRWEWWDEPNTARLFIYCLLKANPTDRKWHGETIERGSFVTSIAGIMKETGLTMQQARTALNRLISTGEITSQATNKYTTITICKYDNYQDVPQSGQQTKQQTNNKQITNKQQTNNKQITNKQQTNNNNEEYKKERIRENNLYLSPSAMRETKKENFEKLDGKGQDEPIEDISSQEPHTPQPAVPATHGSTYADIETLYQAYREEMTSETMTSDAALRLARGYGKILARDQLGEYLDRFQDTRRASGDTHTTHSDYRRHFTNWLRITIQTEIRQQTQNNTNLYSNGRKHRQNATDNRTRQQIADATQFIERL